MKENSQVLERKARAHSTTQAQEWSAHFTSGPTPCIKVKDSSGIPTDMRTRKRLSIISKLQVKGSSVMQPLRLPQLAAQGWKLKSAHPASRHIKCLEDNTRWLRHFDTT
jgi:hypothetical protein